MNKQRIEKVNAMIAGINDFSVARAKKISSAGALLT